MTILWSQDDQWTWWSRTSMTSCQSWHSFCPPPSLLDHPLSRELAALLQGYSSKPMRRFMWFTLQQPHKVTILEDLSAFNWHLICNLPRHLEHGLHSYTTPLSTETKTACFLFEVIKLIRNLSYSVQWLRILETSKKILLLNCHQRFWLSWSKTWVLMCWKLLEDTNAQPGLGAIGLERKILKVTWKKPDYHNISWD